MKNPDEAALEDAIATMSYAMRDLKKIMDQLKPTAMTKPDTYHDWLQAHEGITTAAKYMGNVLGGALVEIRKNPPAQAPGTEPLNGRMK